MGKTGRHVEALESLAGVLLGSVPSFSDKWKVAPWRFLEEENSVISFEPLHISHLGMSKMLKNKYVSYVRSATKCAKKGESI